MKIRSITSFFTPERDNQKHLDLLAKFNHDLQATLKDAGFEVESTRLAAPPFPTWLLGSADSQIQAILQLENQVKSAGWQYLSIGPATPDSLESFALISEILASTSNVFCSAVLSDKRLVYPPAAAACAAIIKKTSTISPDGFSNLRFAALGNVPPNAPFFPAAYHGSNEPPAFSLAMECADEAVKAFSKSANLDEARQEFIKTLEEKAAAIEPLCEHLSNKYKVAFKGFDFSPAPYPEDWCSLGKAIELLGLEHIGGSGSLTAAAVIADTLDHGNWRRVGFNGLMLAVMEDSVLAARAAEGILSVNDLLLYSAVCGTGLDTIPLPGDTTEEELTSVLLDLGSLATRLGKPLTARLMPIPGKKAGEPTEFNFGYFANSRIMCLQSQKVMNPIRSSNGIAINPRSIQSFKQDSN